MKETFSAMFPASTLENMRADKLIEFGVCLGEHYIGSWFNAKSKGLIGVAVKFTSNKKDLQQTRDLILSKMSDLFGHGPINPKFRPCKE